MPTYRRVVHRTTTVRRRPHRATTGRKTVTVHHKDGRITHRRPPTHHRR